jgi:hypothetical protein
MTSTLLVSRTLKLSCRPEDELPIRTVVDRFLIQLDKCRKHYNEVMWIDATQQKDIQTFHEDSLVILMDFSTTCDLR